MSSKKLKKIIIIWYGVLVILSPILVWFGGSVLFIYAFSGFGSGKSDPLLLLLAAFPFILVGCVTYWLHKKYSEAARRDMRRTVTEELAGNAPSFNPEVTILHALEAAGYLSVQELSSRTAIGQTELLGYLQHLIAAGKVERSASMEGIFFRKKASAVDL